MVLTGHQIQSPARPGDHRRELTGPANMAASECVPSGLARQRLHSSELTGWKHQFPSGAMTVNQIIVSFTSLKSLKTD